MKTINSKDFFFNQKNYSIIGSWCPLKYTSIDPNLVKPTKNDSVFSLGKVKGSSRRPLTAWTGGGYWVTEKSFKSSSKAFSIKGEIG